MKKAVQSAPLHLALFFLLFLVQGQVVLAEPEASFSLSQPNSPQSEAASRKRSRPSTPVSDVSSEVFSEESSDASSGLTLGALPDEMSAAIGSYLEPLDLARLKKVSRKVRKNFKENRFRQSSYRADPVFNDPAHDAIQDEDSFRFLYNAGFQDVSALRVAPEGMYDVSLECLRLLNHWDQWRVTKRLYLASKCLSGGRRDQVIGELGRFQFLESLELDLSFLRQVEGWRFPSVIKSLRALRNLKELKITPPVALRGRKRRLLQRVLRSYSRLESLSVSLWEPFQPQDADGAAFRARLDHLYSSWIVGSRPFGGLRLLSLSFGPRFADHALPSCQKIAEGILRHQRTLESLEIDGLEGSESCLESLSAAMRQLTHLKRLTLRHVKFLPSEGSSFTAQALTEILLRRLAAPVHGSWVPPFALESFSFDGVFSSVNETTFHLVLGEFLHSQSGLRHLSLVGRSGNLSHLAGAFGGLSRLESLKLEGTSGQGVSVLLGGLPESAKLKRLNVFLFPPVTPETEPAVLESGESQKALRERLSELSDLEVRGKGCTAGETQGFLEAAIRAPLRRLALPGCELEPAFLGAWVRSFSLLESLDLSHNSQLTGSVVELLGLGTGKVSFPSLRKLDLRGVGLSDEELAGVQTWISWLPRLQGLAIEGDGREISEESATLLLKYLPPMRHLSFQLPRMTEELFFGGNIESELRSEFYRKGTPDVKIFRLWDRNLRMGYESLMM